MWFGANTVNLAQRQMDYYFRRRHSLREWPYYNNWACILDNKLFGRMLGAGEDTITERCWLVLSSSCLYQATGRMRAFSPTLFYLLWTFDQESKGPMTVPHLSTLQAQKKVEASCWNKKFNRQFVQTVPCCFAFRGRWSRGIHTMDTGGEIMHWLTTWAI